MKILVCQVDVPETPDADARDAHAARVAARAGEAARAAGNIDLIAFPELATIEYSPAAFARLDVLAEDPTGPSSARFAELARASGAVVCWGFPRRDEDGGYRISQAAIDPEGRILCVYDKLHLAQFGDSPEKDFFSPGATLGTFEAGGARVGLEICYDFRFPELSRTLALDHGCDVILHPSAFSDDGTMESWHWFARTRAMENQVYFPSLNRAGPGRGRSILCPPWMDGETKATVLGEGEEFRVFETDAAEPARARARFSLRRDRRKGYETLPVTRS